MLSPKGSNISQVAGEPSSESPSSESPSSESSLKLPPPLNEKQLKSLKKKIKYKLNQKKRNDIHVEFAEYLKYLRLIKRIGNDVDQILQPSYLMMHLLTDGCSIVLYTGTYGGTNEVPICRNAAVRLIHGPDMIVMWRKNLLHSDAKSRSKHPPKTNRQASGLSPSILDEQCTTALRSSVSDNHEVKEDLRFFAYVKATQKKGVTRSKDRIPTADGSHIYRLLNNLCENFHNPSECKKL